MKRPPAMSSLLALALAQALGTAAQTCQPSLLGQSDTWTITSQSQLDRISASCTAIDGDVTIASNYTGPLLLPGVSNITGVMTAAGSIGRGNNNRVVDLPDVLSLGGLSLLGPDGVSISIPRATEIGTIMLSGAQATNFSSPRLETAASISLDGGFTELDFRNLTTVTSTLAICSEPGCAPAAGAPMEVDLPALRNASGVSIVGTISALSLPALAGAYRDPAAYEESAVAGLEIGNYGDDALAVNLSGLTEVTGKLGLAGAIDGVACPLLETTAAAIEIRSSAPLEVYFHGLVHARSIHLSGRISSAQFPALAYADSIEIDSSEGIDCGPYEDAQERADSNAAEHGGQLGVFRCSGAEDREDDGGSDGISSKAIAGVVVAAVAGVLGAVCAVLWLTVWGKRKKNARAERMSRGFEMQRPSRRPRTPPPPYPPPPYAP
ncbi:hypothetical protein BDV59DRAFT_200390 [Aspergillus ambiguus]|uniref:uncharacterized protein n=1 Tax=Aspergillus ambiguus TaxID=176160 RepID=UPI003CCE0DB4